MRTHVLGYLFQNIQLIYEMGTGVFHLSFLARQERFFKDRFGKIIYEDTLHFSGNIEDAIKKASDMQKSEM